MKVYHLSYSDGIGGAAKATYRIHQALKKYGTNSKILVNKSIINDPDIIHKEDLISNINIKLKSRLIKVLSNFLVTRNKTLHSPSLIPSSWHKIINNSNADIINLHWIQKEMISIKNITQIKKPLVWTFHDMWPFCGAEHISWDNRWRYGYKKENRPIHEFGFDLNKFVWDKKINYWKKPFSIITPSKWLSECTKKSLLFQNAKVKTIPHCIDLNAWEPIDKIRAKEILGIRKDIPMLLAGSLNSNSDPNKGFDLLVKSLSILKSQNINFNLVIFGESKNNSSNYFCTDTIYLGHIKEQSKMQIIYSAADILMIPSKIESFSNIAMEAHACGTPVVSFATSGLNDVVKHKVTGYKAIPFEVSDFSKGIEWCLKESSGNSYINLSARKRSEHLWNEKRISNLYKNFYEEVISENV